MNFLLFNCSDIRQQPVKNGLKGDIKIGDKTYGLVLDIGGYEKNVITLAPSLLISEEEIDLGIQLFEALLKRCGAE